ncbi:hypothetical protein HYH03_003833 [Edaphochlamys debaryana]|uniref:Plastid lipid-associated protein/fibrillin conserved domain-containing protein n=1 Tax=Edaphochlamys debaryana TaxID=47281 RepID=A0A836C3Q9_9CHLO|nr:hypothetical protein HYH03_003833 [Edaphochlamys debaryana]|eukprot:KAG2498073.1 hypothetical protein HYH03_003833 [Edaphochlamys debaryana]
MLATKSLLAGGPAQARASARNATAVRVASTPVRRDTRAHALLADTPVELLPSKLQLLQKVAGLNRGAIATSNDKYEVSSYVETLEEHVEESEAAASGVTLDSVQGKWELIYSSVEQFRSSPFFWAFQEGLVQSREVAQQIFAFTDSIPGATVGAAYQTISFDTGMLISEVDLEVFPMLRGTVVTTSSVTQEPPTTLSVTVQNTRVANSNLIPFLDNVSVPVQELVEAVRGPGSTRVTVDITYMDGDMRIARTRPDNEIFIYRKV